MAGFLSRTPAALRPPSESPDSGAGPNRNHAGRHWNDLRQAAKLSCWLTMNQDILISNELAAKANRTVFGFPAR